MEQRAAVAAADNGLRAPELAAGIARVKLREVRSASGPANWLALRQAQALTNARDITTTKGLRDPDMIAGRLGCALRRPQVAPLTDRRSSGGFTLEATVAARHANAPELSV